MEELLCPFEGSTYLFFSPEIPALIHYSHAVAILAALAIGFFIFAKNPRSVVAKLMLLFVLLFTFWAALDVILWATNRASVVMFSWSIQVLIEPIAHVVAFYLFYLHVYKRTPSTLLQYALFALLLPVIILLPSTQTLTTLYHPFCESYEGFIAEYYTYGFHIAVMGAIVFMAFRKIPRMAEQERGAAIAFVVGLITFLLMFSSGNIIGSFTDDWTYSQYGLFGMPIFASLLAYSMVKFKAFNTKAIGAQILVAALALGVLSLVTLNDIETVRIVASLTFILVCILGFALVRSVRKEVKQRREIERLAEDLQKANKRLKILDKMKSEFVSIASHQLRSPLTAIRGYTSMLLEGSYGKVPKKAQEAIERIADSSRFMALSVEDYLNVSRIEAGNMKYEMADFNLKDAAEKIVDEMRPAALKKGLLLTFRSDCDGSCRVHADIGKTRQIIMNLIDNAMKYTQKGSITVIAHDDAKKKKMYVSVKDTGVGMSKETLDDIFDKFIRAKNANEVNVTGTGLGLFVAKKMAKEMNGDIWAESKGEGQGSTFHLELPLLPGKRPN